MKAWINVSLAGRLALAGVSVLLSACSCPTGVQRGWTADAVGPVPGRCGARVVALDGHGHAAAAGSVWAGLQSDIGYTALYELKSGKLLWSQTQIGQPNGDYDVVNRVAFDGDGNVVSAGTSTRLNAYACWAAKYDKATGNPLWSVQIPEKGWAQCLGMCVACNGDVVLTGQAGSDVKADVFTARLDGRTGALLWAKTYDSPTHLADIGHAVVTGTGGDVLVCGDRVVAPGNADTLVLCYDGATGNQKWMRTYDGPAHGVDNGVDLAVDDHWDVFVTGISSGPGTRFDILTWKLDGRTGDTLWTNQHDGRRDDRGVAVAVKGTDVVVAGHVDESADDDGVVLKFDGKTGALKWERRFVSAPSAEDDARGIAFDSCGNVFVSGALGKKDGAMVGFVAACDGKTGELLWQEHFDAVSPQPEYFSGLAVGPKEVVVGGSASVGTANQPSRFLVVKYNRVNR